MLRAMKDIIKRSPLYNGVEIRKTRAFIQEAVWASIFNNTISGSTWLLDKSFSPGRWAVTYGYLYVMYRYLDERKPKRVLDLGLGQSSKLLGQYAASHEDVMHFVVEHDPEWIAFCENNFRFSDRSSVVRLDLDLVPFKGVQGVRVFHGFQDTFAGQKFDLISVDAPLGSDMKHYSRTDILNLLPACLSEDFIIMIDDTQRSGEKHTIRELLSILDGSGIPWRLGTYEAAREFTVICSRSNGFFTSL